MLRSSGQPKVKERKMAGHTIHEHHEKAAHHHEQAAKHHREAAKHHIISAQRNQALFDVIAVHLDPWGVLAPKPHVGPPNPSKGPLKGRQCALAAAVSYLIQAQKATGLRVRHRQY
jgi:hypothetical protein